ncbi:MAG: helix-turn-helix transcriptional regulator [Clostridia bacterium]|nr:helix-turn-helix transcriptional regulator [Clostridia bacterium]
MDKFAERLYELREEAGLTMAELARAVGVSDATICKWEKGETSPMSYAVIALAQFFGVTADYLLGLDDYCQAGRDRGE